MNPRFPLVFSALAVASFCAAAPALAQVSVIGGGMARDCYRAVEFAKTPTSPALKLCSEALDQERLNTRDRAATYVNRGILFMRQGAYERALWDYQEGLALQPSLLEAKVDAGAALYGLKRYDEAFAALNEGLKTDSVEARAVGLYNRALIYERRGDDTAAYNDFREALELKPGFVEAARQLGRFTVTVVDGEG